MLFAWVSQAVELLTDINKLAAQARRFLRSDSKAARPSPSQATPRSPASSSHPGTPPPDYGGDSATSPLLSPRRSVEGRPQPQSQGLSRNNSTELRSRNLARPFSAAAAQGENRKEKTTPLGVNLTRSQITYQAAQTAQGDK